MRSGCRLAKASDERVADAGHMRAVGADTRRQPRLAFDQDRRVVARRSLDHALGDPPGVALRLRRDAHQRAGHVARRQRGGEPRRERGEVGEPQRRRDEIEAAGRGDGHEARL